MQVNTSLTSLEPIPARFVREFERWNVTLYRSEPWQPQLPGYARQGFDQKMASRRREHFARFFPAVEVAYFVDSDWIIVKEPPAPCLHEIGANGFYRDWNIRALVRLGVAPTVAANIPTIATTQMMSMPMKYATEFFNTWEHLFFAANVLTAASTSFTEAESRQYYVCDMFAAGLVFLFRGFSFSPLSFYHWKSWNVAGCPVAAVDVPWHPCAPRGPITAMSGLCTIRAAGPLPASSCRRWALLCPLPMSTTSMRAIGPSSWPWAAAGAICLSKKSNGPLKTFLIPFSLLCHPICSSCPMIMRP